MKVMDYHVQIKTHSLGLFEELYITIQNENI
jgi:hypothetical protein